MSMVSRVLGLRVRPRSVVGIPDSSIRGAGSHQQPYALMERRLPHELD